jgi:nucleoid-associated protein YgaU
LQSYLYANNKPISQAAGNQALALKKLTLQGGQPIEAPIDPLTGEPGASTGSRLLIEEGDIARTASGIDRTATARNIAARAYAGSAGEPGFAQLSASAQDKVAAYVLAQLPPDAEIVAGAQVTLHAFILMVDASYSGLTQITDYSLRQLGSDAIPGGTVQSHVVRAGDTLQTIARRTSAAPPTGTCWRMPTACRAASP